MTKKGVLIDVCPACHGVWLDQGEINVFLKNWSILKQYLHFGLHDPHSIPTKCPKCHENKMQKGIFPGLSYVVEKCSACHGLYLDADEFAKLQGNKNFSQIQEDTSVSRSVRADKLSGITSSVKLPSLGLATCLVTGSLYAILFGVAVLIMEVTGLPVWVGSSGLFVFIALEFYFAPILLDWQLRLLGSLDWVSVEEFPKHFQDSLLKLCRDHHLPLPRVGIIRDNSPQAYTYGRTPYSARLVLSEGLFQILDQDEIEAVLAHELGHIKHWDFVVMTVIKVVPIMLYNFYVNCRESDNVDSEDGNAKIYVAIVAYIAYLIADYLVLFVSRVREYHADKFSCFATKKPNQLIKALVKISYGLLQSSPAKTDAQNKEGHAQADRKAGFEALNIMGISGSKKLALTQRGGENFDPESIKDIMRWDLWNPWAFYYEMHSTHPLTAKRINAIASYALKLKQKPYLVFDKQKPESYWDDFLLDLGVVLLPYVLAVAGFWSYFIVSGESWGHIFSFDSNVEMTKMLPIILPFLAYSVLGLSIGGLIRTLRAYPGGLFDTSGFFHSSVAALLKIIKVSPVRSYPVILNGQILGRGVAGQVLSEDFFFKDKTGLIFLNHEPFGLNLWFGLFHFKKFQGKDVVVKGWYRRSPTPIIEVKTIKTFDYSSKSYTYYYKLGFSLLGILISVAFMLFLGVVA